MASHNTVTITGGNASYVQLNFKDIEMRRVLNDKYSFFLSKAVHMASYKKGHWNGNIYFLTPQNKWPTGLIPQLKETCKEMGVDLVDARPPVESLKPTPAIIKDFIKSLNLTYEPYDYQMKSFITAVLKGRSLCISPTSSGKSLMIYLYVMWHRRLNPDQPALILVPSKSLVSQLADDFVEYGYDEGGIVQIAQGVKKETAFDAKIVFSTWQSLYKQPYAYYKKLNNSVIVADEVHKFKANEVKKLFDNMPNVNNRVGFTGTLTNNDADSRIDELTLRGIFGEPKQFVTTDELMSRGKVAQLKIKMLDITYSKDTCFSLPKKYEYMDEVSFLEKHKPRNDFIINLTMKCKGSTLLLFKTIEHGKYLRDRLKEVSDKPVYFIDGSVKAAKRDEIKAAVEKEDAILVASLGTTSTGVSIKGLDNMMIVSPTKSRITVIQSIGRLLRLQKEGDNKVKFFDFADNLSTPKRTNFTYNHAKRRLEYYFEEDFHVDVTKINLK